jgi:hypothetical protein
MNWELDSSSGRNLEKIGVYIMPIYDQVVLAILLGLDRGVLMYGTKVRCWERGIWRSDEVRYGLEGGDFGRMASLMVSGISF